MFLYLFSLQLSSFPEPLFALWAAEAVYLAAFYFCACVDLHAFQPAAEGTIAVFPAGAVCVPVVQQSPALGLADIQNWAGFPRPLFHGKLYFFTRW